MIKTVLAFFSGADGIVNDNLCYNFLKKIKVFEVQTFYHMQALMEDIHNETYSLFIDVLITDRAEKDMILDAIHTMPGVQKMYHWAQRWINHDTAAELADPDFQYYSERYGYTEAELDELAFIWSTAKQIVAFACVEGIMFSGAFAIIYWLKERSIMSGLTFSNELISRDEGMHRNFAIMLYRHINLKLPSFVAAHIICEATEHSKELIANCMGRFTGMNRDDMAQYIEFVADGLAQDLGLDLLYGAKNPFQFMDKSAFNGMTNFFEKKVSEYSKAEREEIVEVENY